MYFHRLHWWLHFGHTCLHSGHSSRSSAARANVSEFHVQRYFSIFCLRNYCLFSLIWKHCPQFRRSEQRLSHRRRQHSRLTKIPQSAARSAGRSSAPHGPSWRRWHHLAVLQPNGATLPASRLQSSPSQQPARLSQFNASVSAVNLTTRWRCRWAELDKGVRMVWVLENMHPASTFIPITA